MARSLSPRPRLWPPSPTVISLALTVALLAGMVAASSLLRDLGPSVLRALPALPAAIAVHGFQIAAAAMAWRLISHVPRPAPWLMVRARWVRESLNGLLPLVGIGGGVLAGQAIARQTGRPFAGVAAGATVDLLLESITQLPFLLTGLLLFSTLAPGVLSLGQAALLAAPLAAAASFVAVLTLPRARGLSLRLADRLGFGAALGRLTGALGVVNAAPRALLGAAAWHLLAWTLGAAEVWIILQVMGTPVSFAAAFAIESLGMAARSLGFALPAGLGAQEAGLAAVATGLGVPAEAAVAMAMLKRLREVTLSLPGLLFWRWSLRRSR
jgi:Lysylphosphatidylglycerol synthase TM region